MTRLPSGGNDLYIQLLHLLLHIKEGARSGRRVPTVWTSEQTVQLAGYLVGMLHHRRELLTSFFSFFKIKSVWRCVRDGGNIERR